MTLQLREAEFRHICDAAKLYTVLASPDSEASRELFDSLDCLRSEELTEVVAIYLLGRQQQVHKYSEARRQALDIGLTGVALLHSTPELENFLHQGIRQLEKEGLIHWKDSYP